jgi:hypothetical protein
MKLPRPMASADLPGEEALSWNAAGIPYPKSLPASRRFVGRAFRPDKRDWRGAPNLCADSPATSIPEKNLRAQRQSRTLPARPLQHFSEEAR